MIITVTPNAALDVTYHVDELRPQHSHRVRAVHQRAGGKGVNVASVLALMGHEVVTTGFAGGATGTRIRADLDVRGLRHRLVESDGESRRTINVVSAADGEATIFNEPGPQVPAARWQDLLDDLCRLLDSTADPVVVLSGSLPRGVPTDAYAEMITLCRGRGAGAIVDTSGAPLLSAISAGPDLVKPNTAEVFEAVAIQDPVQGAAELRRGG
ncbi:MAG TPA: PfkB family carbohydrate kinase, partial [Propionibacteriaceae bacterium]|nr:PfkB family carbohydrate kinase [Propionibacteriaceae bacterium]